MDPGNLDIIILIIAKILAEYQSLYLVKEPCRNSWYTGQSFVLDILSGNPTQCYELFRMEKYVFLRLCAAIKERNLLKDTRNMRAEEQLAIFLMTIGHNERNRMIQERFQHSGETVS